MGIDPSNTAQDVQITFFIKAISAAITRSCNRTHFLASNAANPITQYYSGAGDQYLILLNPPVQNVVSIYEDDVAWWNSNTGAFSSESLLTAGQDYSLVLDGEDGTYSKSGIVYRLNGMFWPVWTKDDGNISSYVSGGKGNIKVTYTSGFSFLPADLSYATATCVARALNSAALGYPFAEEHYQDYGYRLDLNKSNIWGMFGDQIGPVIAKYRLLRIGRQV